MRSRKFGMALMVSLLVSALGVGSALGAATTKAGEWYVGSGSGTTLTTDQASTTQIVSGPWVVGTMIGTKTVKLTATALECIGCTLTNAEITGRAGKVAMAKGKIKWTGVTVDSPVRCRIRDMRGGTVGTITSKNLLFHGDWTNGTETIAYQQLFPESGEVLASFYLESSEGGGECEAVEGQYNMTGTLFGQQANATGVQATEQKLSFSPAIQSATGSALKIGANVAELTGSMSLSIGGSAFGIH